jgi:hypothetical protein
MGTEYCYSAGTDAWPRLYKTITLELSDGGIAAAFYNALQYSPAS